MHRQQWAYFKICGFYLKLSLWCVVVLNFFIPHAHFTVSPTAFRCLRSSRGCISFSAFAPVNIWVISISKSTPSTRPNLSVVNLWMTQQLTARYCILDDQSAINNPTGLHRVVICITSECTRWSDKTEGNNTFSTLRKITRLSTFETSIL